jgi:hypothetical protein
MNLKFLKKIQLYHNSIKQKKQKIVNISEAKFIITSKIPTNKTQQLKVISNKLYHIITQK